MSCCIHEGVWTVARGEALDLIYLARDSSGAPLELEGVTVTIVEANQPALAATTITILNAEHGLIGITTTEAAARTLPSGLLSFLRLRFAWPAFPGASSRVTDRLGVSVE